MDNGKMAFTKIIILTVSIIVFTFLLNQLVDWRESNFLFADLGDGVYYLRVIGPTGQKEFNDWLDTNRQKIEALYALNYEKNSTSYWILMLNPNDLSPKPIESYKHLVRHGVL